MNTIYTKEELDSELKSLKAKRLTVHNKRKDLLQKYSAKQTKTLNSASAMHDLDRKIEDLERKLEILF
ncbi:MAG: hypothetical protein ACJA0Q_000002 [Saprospiraceae bacterium]|jgi:hypothetical protein